MKDSTLMSPPQRAVALTTIAKEWFKPECVDKVLDRPVKEFNNASPIQHARKGIAEFEEARRYLLVDLGGPNC